MNKTSFFRKLEMNAASNNSINSNKREDIIKASIELFVSEGFDRPSMDSIAAKANVSKRTLYKYFSSKRSLLDEILIHLIGQNQNALDFHFQRERPLPEQLENIIGQKARFLLCSSNIKLAKIIISEHLKDEGILHEEIENVLKQEKATLVWMEEAQKAGCLRTDKSPIQHLTFLNELINGIIFYPVLFGKKNGIDQTEVKNIASMFLSVSGTKKNAP